MKTRSLKQILSVTVEWELSPRDTYIEGLIPNEMMPEAGLWEMIDWAMNALRL